MLETKPFSY